jgi:ATP-dependent Lon protease
MDASARATGIEAALTELPIFPLPQVVLFPQAVLPLHIFEPRYRAMLRDCLATHKWMAMALVIGPPHGPDPVHPPIRSVAGAGMIVEHQPLPDGRANVLLHGCVRVRLEELPFVPPYRRAKATLLSDVNDAHDPVTSSERASLLALVSAFAADIRRHNPDFTFQVPSDLEAGVLSDYCAHHLIVDTHVRQTLLEELRPKERVRIVTRELAAQHGALLRESGGLLH